MDKRRVFLRRSYRKVSEHARMNANTNRSNKFGGKHAKIIFDYLYKNISSFNNIETIIYGFKDKKEFSVQIDDKVYYFDFYIRFKNGKEVDIEYDSTIHDDLEIKIKDKIRDNQLELKGFDIIRIHHSLFGRKCENYDFLNSIIEEIKENYNED